MERKKPNMEELIEELCRQIHKHMTKADLETVQVARNKLTKLQNHDIYERILGPEDTIIEAEPSAPIIDKKDDTKSTEHVSSSTSISTHSISTEALLEEEELGEDDYELLDESLTEEGCIMDIIRGEIDFTDDAWYGFFDGYRMLHSIDEFSWEDSKKCIEITREECDARLDVYLHAGVRAFVIDLFSRPLSRNQEIIVAIREREIKISKEYGFSIKSSVFAKLSPRLQYTGLLEPHQEFEVKPGDLIGITTNRLHEVGGDFKRIYVNARFLLCDLKICDYLFIGFDIQVRIKTRCEDRIRCIVSKGGRIKSRMPVLFPQRCYRFRLSFEEIEDITFCKEVGIYGVISYLSGTPEYYNNLRYSMDLLDCHSMRLMARVALNELKGCEEDMNWMAENYDGFIYTVTVPDNAKGSQLLHLCPSGDSFVKMARHKKRLIFLDIEPFIYDQIVVRREHFDPIYLHPDKYIVNKYIIKDSFRFCVLQSARFEQLVLRDLTQHPFCDTSNVGSDALARSIVLASYIMNAKVIIVCSQTGRMATKISFFRPKAMVILITNLESIFNFLMMHHNIQALPFRQFEDTSDSKQHMENIYKQTLYAIIYCKCQRILQHKDNLIVVYREDTDTLYSDTYLTYKFHEKKFIQELRLAMINQKKKSKDDKKI